ncbi:hypothetical protein J7T55_011261 [Diaporthe amygdali]|uniref:uncharacterized protein n=1 Tax=Phomopsis amygdali TaxID=1214568 RepID=UPI0022FDE586|nr:uncharacterized protein J7T55_011261 [Diaporthe amygdali]KAJ0108770.1 hypothetical protein J7T55_011261 [Diaporthe amygdali]
MIHQIYILISSSKQVWLQAPERHVQLRVWSLSGEKDEVWKCPVELWHEIVSRYSGLSLSKEQERLAAIATISRQLSFYRPAEVYMAGLRSGSLLLDLMWRSFIPSHGNQESTWTSSSAVSAVNFMPFQGIARQICRLHVPKRRLRPSSASLKARLSHLIRLFPYAW